MYYIGGSEFEFEQLRSNSPLKTPNSGGGALEPDAGPKILAIRLAMVHTAPGSPLGSIPYRTAEASGQNFIGSPTYSTVLMVILV